ncbi:SulP family inorganic anion transporter [Gimesia sp.]|uniref:bifunctional SulP family inorganic anion transporter/carbonic anhydrase n=1 Tax=Gimesia sp. TaxID=2024833 RepID=UPI000C42E125|nr:SulP family inorganic anion transporter [Gimesia sp.]MAX37061.1 sulfate transporter [Gimesia sp.]HBL43529.1 sulfate transporter [Planctomycetaceae bacterium]|tara:strand:+ start:2078 stop:4324 length:2247 start_codon:yes stop_codon:yes gene_type:complete
MSRQTTLADSLRRDLTASLVIFLVALPLCLGIALASNAPLISGLISGIIGGIVVGTLSHSQTSVSGPAAGLTAVVSTQIALLGSFESFLMAVALAGLIQVIAGLLRAGFVSMFIPSGVVKGMLTGIGLLLILKQFPYLVGYDIPLGKNISFTELMNQNIFHDLVSLAVVPWHAGAMTIGIFSIILLLIWDRIQLLKGFPIPGPLIVVAVAVAINQLIFVRLGPAWHIRGAGMVQVPVFSSLEALDQIMLFPDFSTLADSKVYVAAITIAIVASLETLLNLEAVDRLDPRQRHSPRSRELFAQGCGNITAGLLGGLPVTSVIVRSSLNINSGGQTKFSAIMNGFLLLGCFLLIPQFLNLIPLACLAGILLVTGCKLASPNLIRQMYQAGRYQFIPYSFTAVTIVVADILTGILTGLATSVSFILYSNMRSPLHRILEKHVGGEIMRIELASQVSFFNRAAIERALLEIPQGGYVVIDARKTDYIDPDVLTMLSEFQNITAPARGIHLSLRGFRKSYDLIDEIQTIDYTAGELQGQLTPDDVIILLREGNKRFRSGILTRGESIQDIQDSLNISNAFVTILSCSDCYMNVESIFDLRPGNACSVQVSGNVIDPEVVTNLEYGCIIANTSLLLVMGHTHCRAIRSSLDQRSIGSGNQGDDSTHLDDVFNQLTESINDASSFPPEANSLPARPDMSYSVNRHHILYSIELILNSSEPIRNRVQEGTLRVAGALYHDDSGYVELFDEYNTAGQ